VVNIEDRKFLRNHIKTPLLFMSPILFIGLDAADWELLSLKIAAGKLPHLSKMVTHGVSGPLRSISPLFSPALWATIGTGKHSYEHGITGFTYADHSGMGLRPYDRTSRRSPAIWNMFSHYKKTSTIVGWWTTAPAEKIRGAMIDETFRIAHHPSHEPWSIPPKSVSPWSLSKIIAQDRVHPQQLSEALLRFLVPKLYEIDPTTDFRVAAIAKILAEDLTTLQVTLHLMRRKRQDLTSLYLVGLDSLSHLAMCYREPALPGEKPRDCELYGEVVDRAYELYDRWIGELVEAAGEESTIVIASDHGFYHDARRPSSLGIQETAPTHQHAPIGTLIMKGTQIRQGAAIHHATILDLCPTLLAIAGLPIGRDMPGKVLLKSFSKKPIIKKISSWDGFWKAPWSPSTPSPESTEAALRQLVSLGYLQEIPFNKQAAIQEAHCNEIFHLALSFLHDDRLDQAIPLLEQARSAARKAGQALLRTDILEELATAYLLVGERRRAATCFYHIARYRRRDAKQALRQFWEKADSSTNKTISFQEAWEIRHLMARATLDEEKINFIATSARFLAHSKSEDLELLLTYAHAHPEDSAAQFNAGLFALGRIFHTDHLPSSENQMDAALDSHFDMDSMHSYCPASKYVSALTRSLPLLSSFQGCLKEVFGSPPAVSRPPVVPHQPSQLPRHDQYEISGLAYRTEKKGVALLRNVAKVRHEEADALAFLAIYYNKKKKPLEAEECAREAILRNPLHRFSWLALATSLSHQGRWSAAWKAAQEASKSFLYRSDAFRLLAHIALDGKNNPSQALQYHCESEKAKINLQSALGFHSSPIKKISSLQKKSSLRISPKLSTKLSPKRSSRLSSNQGPIIVTGLPRSGTSLMMQMLAAGGIAINTDYHRCPDEHNPNGYFEHEKVKTMSQEAFFLKAGRATKVVIPLALNLPAQNHYRIIWMRRSLQEVITSQHRMAGSIATVDQLYNVYRHYEITMAEHIDHANWPLLCLEYSSVVQDPHQAARSIAHFLKRELPIDTMAAAVIPSLYRVNPDTQALYL